MGRRRGRCAHVAHAHTLTPKPWHTQLRAVWEETPREVHRFLNMLLNDLVHALNIGLDALEAVHRIETEAPDPAEGAIHRFIRETETAARLGELERQSGFMNEYSQGLLALLSRIAPVVPDALSAEETAGRVASLVGTILNRLTGPGCGDLKVRP